MSNYGLALIAEAGAGKDFLAEYLIKKYGYSRYAFADNVKLVAETWFPEQYGDESKKPRKLLQDVGTKFREINEEVWINSMFRDIENSKIVRHRQGHEKEHIIITDCRLPNEYEALKREGYTFIRVQADLEVRMSRLKQRGDDFKEEDLKHHSESFYDSFECEYEIDNNGTPDELYEKADEIMNKIMEHKT